MKNILFFFLGFISVSVTAQDSIKFNLNQVFDNIAGNDLALADFNNDNNIDVLIANGIWNKPLPSKLWINDGAGHFSPASQEIGNSKSWGVAADDVNDDGYTDIFIANGDWNQGDSSYLWFNNGKGEFTRSPIKFGVANSSCAAIGDLNGDGKPDIFIANHPYSNGQGGEDEVWFSNKENGFINSGQKLGGNAPARRVKLADINNDSHLDAIVLNGDINSIWKNNGKGKFTESKQNIGNGENVDLVSADIDNDNDIDIVIAKGAWGKQPKGVEIWTNDGSGDFTKTQNIGEYDCYGLAYADLNHDNFNDIILVNGAGQPNQIMFNDKHGNFYITNIDIGKEGNKVAISDVNHDNLADLIIIGNENTKVYLQTR
jgi:hypothetical protein